MEYNAQYKILFEKSILNQLFTAYKYDFDMHEEIDEIYANTRMYDETTDKVHFIYHDKHDYGKLAKFVKKKRKKLDF